MSSKLGPRAVGPKSVIAGVQGALPPNRYSQAEITEAFLKFPAFAGHEKIVRSLHSSAKVGHRHLVLPIDAYPGLNDFGEANDLFIEHAVELACKSLTACSMNRSLASPKSFSPG